MKIIIPGNVIKCNDCGREFDLANLTQEARSKVLPGKFYEITGVITIKKDNEYYFSCPACLPEGWEL